MRKKKQPDNSNAVTAGTCVDKPNFSLSKTQTKCPICYKTIPGTRNLSFHMALHPVYTPEICNYCIKVFRTKDELLKHVENEHVSVKEAAKEMQSPPKTLAITNSNITDRLCPICFGKISDTENLSFHMALHPVDRPVFCPYCIRVFRTNKECFKHVKHEHELVKRFQCACCPRKFGTSASLKRHNLIHNKNEKPFKCPYCDDTFNNKNNWRKHEVQHRGFTEFVCELCEVGFWKEDKYLDHVKAGTCTTKNIECCGHLYMRIEYINHFEQAHDNRRSLVAHQCKFCNKAFPYPSDKEAHEVNCNSNNSQQKRKRGMPKRSSDDNELHICAHCGLVLNSQIGLKAHLSNKHSTLEQPSLREYQCTLCEKRFETYTSMYRHKQIHLKKHVCEICTKRFAHKHILMEHIKIVHEHLKPYQCTVCGKCFGSYSTLSVHENVHSDSRRYKCRYCESRFKRCSAKRKHELTHEDTKPYKYKICGAGFSQPNSCKRHEKTHERETVQRKFTCKDCSENFKSLAQLNKHKQAMHNSEKGVMTRVNSKQFLEVEAKQIVKQLVAKEGESKQFVEKEEEPKSFLDVEDDEHWFKLATTTCLEEGNVYTFVVL